MLDFVSIKTIEEKKDVVITPEFKVMRSKDLMIRGKAFYAVWNEATGFWSQDESDVQRMVDEEVHQFVDQNTGLGKVKVKLLKNFSSRKWTEWQQYCKSLPDQYVSLDEQIHFSNDEIKKSDYATKCLPYPLLEQPTPAYDEMMSLLYEPKELEKIEWGIGAIISGDSKWIQKFMVLYGGPGTGKSTVLNLIQHMFEGYWSLLEAKALTKDSDFALESLKNNSLIAIQHDGDLSKIEDNSKLNSVVSHEEMVVNEKFKSKYSFRFHSMLWIGTNKPVKITDSKSGIIRRLIDIQPTGQKHSRKTYDRLWNAIQFEYSGIAFKCLARYRSLGSGYYDGYIAEDMLTKTNDFYNFIEDNYDLFESIGEDGLTLSVMWRRYKEYCEDANVSYPLPMRIFKDEMKNYFERFEDRVGSRYSVYYGFLKNKFKGENDGGSINYVSVDGVDCSNGCGGEWGKETVSESWLSFDREESLLDDVLADWPAQYATDFGTPMVEWSKCTKKLRDLDTRKLHYVMGPENMIAIDFDLKNEKGEKDFERNLEAASLWPPTYAELSKSGAGIHLHYYCGIPCSKLARLVSPDIEIKVFTGKSSLRRARSKCNGLEIATISSGLPLRKEKKVLKEEVIKSEQVLRDLIKRNLRKEIHPATKPSMDFIAKILEDAYVSGLKYDVRDMRPAIQNFAMHSSHQAEYCLRLINKMEFCSEEPSDNLSGLEELPIAFYDVEVFPNLFLVCYKKPGAEEPVQSICNPKPEDVEQLVTTHRLIGFNNRRYDNHMMYAAMMGYTPEQIFRLSQRIIVEEDKNAFFGEAYNLSYTDVYDFLSAQNKMSLKKWEIKFIKLVKSKKQKEELSPEFIEKVKKIKHQELDLPWDQPAPKEKWPKVIEYCGYDVLATECVFDYNTSDWLAREILAEWADMTVNDTTNSLTTRLIVGKDPNPQSKYIYTDLSKEFPGYEFNLYGIPKERYKPGAKIVTGKSIYMGEDPGEGGRVYAEPGMYTWVAVLDVESQHPHTAVILKIFGEEYTLRFEQILKARLFIKHKEYDEAKKILPEKLHKYFEDKSAIKKLAGALKTAINSVYGLTSAKFPNKLKDPRNVDNIVAKRGALFMMNLQKEVQKMGYTVVHIKTDSIKIANADEKIIQWVKEYGLQYGYTFEHEATYAKMCLVNESTYIALVAEEEGKKVEPYWTATGEQFQVPYVFKTLFSHEEMESYDLTETKSVSTAMYLDFNESLPDVSKEEKVRELRYKRSTNSKLTRKEEAMLSETDSWTSEELEEKIEKGHDYRFVGKVGLFCPVVENCGGGILLREISEKNRRVDKFAAVAGTKKPNGDPYRWMDFSMVEELHLEERIDRSYFSVLVDEAVESISKYGDFEWFSSSDTEAWLKVPEYPKEEMPFEEYMNMPDVVK